MLANGTPLTTALSFNVTNNNYFHADIYRAEFALFDATFGPNWWGTQDSTLVLTFQASLDGGQSWTPLITGQLDSVHLLMDGGIVQVAGRDLSARLIEAKTTESYQNQTSSQIATLLAGRHGLTADVQATSTPVGRYYSADHEETRLNQFSHATTEWDLLVFLAQREQFSVWVTGTTLHFKSVPVPGAATYAVTWGYDPLIANVEKLSMGRSLTLAKDVAVGVRSWSSRHARGFTKWSPAKPTGANGTVQQFIYTFPNLTEDEALQKAAALRADITKNERIVEFAAPLDLVLTPQQMVQVSGTRSSWDQTYYIDHIVRMISLRGATMEVRCKNHSPESQPNL